MRNCAYDFWRVGARAARVFVLAMLGGCVVAPHDDGSHALPATRAHDFHSHDHGRGPATATRSAKASEGLERFAAMREALWNFETERAVALLRELKRDDMISEDLYRMILLRTLEEGGRWSEAADAYAEFELENALSARVRYVKFMATLPPPGRDFTAEPPEIPFQLWQGDCVIAAGEINGVPARLLIDTGAATSIVANDFARRSGVELFEQTVPVRDYHGHDRDAALARVRELRLGGVRVTNLAAVSSATEPAPGIPADAIVGWDVLQHAEVIFNFPAATLTLAAPRAARTGEPSVLGGRSSPIIRVRSREGRAMYFLFDTGYSDKGIQLFENGGLLGAKTEAAQFRRTWKPQVTRAANSWSWAWPRVAQPFVFFIERERFEVPSAALYDVHRLHENLLYLDGIVGNAPFLGGRVRLCGVRREFDFEPTSAHAAASASTRP